MRGNAPGLLPMGAKQFDCLKRVECGVIHPMVRLAHERQIIGGIVACIMVKMGDGQARPDLQAAYDATAHRICGSRDLARFALLSDEGRHSGVVWWPVTLPNLLAPSLYRPSPKVLAKCPQDHIMASFGEALREAPTI